MKLVILDRDGTINHDSEDFIKSPNEWRPIEGSLEAIARLAQAGYRIVVATNQSGIARGVFYTPTPAAPHDPPHPPPPRAPGGGWGAPSRFFSPPPAAPPGPPPPQPRARGGCWGGRGAGGVGR